MHVLQVSARALPKITCAQEPHPIEKGFAMFVAFTLFGSMPLLGFVVTAMIARGMYSLSREGIASDQRSLACASVSEHFVLYIASSCSTSAELYGRPSLVSVLRSNRGACCSRLFA